LTLGDSLVALHLLPAIAGALVVWLTGMTARELGGGRFAQGLAALASLVVVTYLGIDSIFSMDPFDELWWTLAAYLLIVLLKRDRPRLWLLFGLVCGVGLTTKVTMLFFGFAVVVGLLLTTKRALLGTRWAWLGGAIAVVFFAPYVLWNLTNGLPTVEFWSHYGGKLVGISPLTFFLQQVITMNPVTLPLWLTGLYFFFLTKAGAEFRNLGWTWVVLYVLFTISGAKFYFLAPAYPMLLAAGAVTIESATRRQTWSWVRPAYLALLIGGGLAVAPLALPLLPPATFGQVYGFLGGDAGVQDERHQTTVLPQWLADRFGWDTMVAQVARVYDGLPASDRAVACVFTDNYGEAGAVDFFGPRYGLPAAISGHNNYFLWGPRGCTGQVVISVGVARSDLTAAFGEVTAVGETSCQNCMPYEDHAPLFISRQPKEPINALWPTVKHFD
ncbi:MAG: glycosyltransferase family 39 protein, partial [Chloroflexota bacterium]